MTDNNRNAYVVGLDIGTTKICSIIGRKNDRGRIEVLGMGKAESLGVNRGVVVNIDQTVSAIQESLNAASKQAGNLEIKEVFVGIAGQHIRSSLNNHLINRKDFDLEITQEEIDRMQEEMFQLGFPNGEKVIHVFPQEYTIDNEQGITHPVGMFGSRIEANYRIITGHISSIKNIYRCVERAGYQVGGLILEPIASSLAVLAKEEKEAGIALVDIGGGTTDIAIFQNNILRHAAVVPFGGNIVTEDIKEGCKIMRQQAELVKTRFGIALSEATDPEDVIVIPGLKGRENRNITRRNLASIIQARLEEVFDQVYYEIYNSGYSKKLIGGIVLTGGGSQLKYLQQLVSYKTGMETRIGYSEVVEKGANDEVIQPMYATGIGLLMEGFNMIDKRLQEGQQPTLNMLNNQDQSQQNPVQTEKDTDQKGKKKGIFEGIINQILGSTEEDEEL